MRHLNTTLPVLVFCFHGPTTRLWVGPRVPRISPVRTIRFLDLLPAQQISLVTATHFLAGEQASRAQSATTPSSAHTLAGSPRLVTATLFLGPYRDTRTLLVHRTHSSDRWQVRATWEQATTLISDFMRDT